MAASDAATGSALFTHYQTKNAFYDELFDSNGQPRSHYQALYQHLLNLPADELARRQNAADLSFYRL